MILLAPAMVPDVAAPSEELAPAGRRGPSAAPCAAILAVGVGAALALAATYPARRARVGRQRHVGHGDGRRQRASAGGLVGLRPPATQPGRVEVSGLDLANTPYMIMSGTHGMDMNGADASAAAGLNTTKVEWHYTGPALPPAWPTSCGRRQQRTRDIHMAVTGCAQA